MTVGKNATMFTFHSRLGTALALVLVLAGCAGGSSAWIKPGVNSAQRADDFGDCRDQTRQATQRNYAIDQDINASQGNIVGAPHDYSSQTSRIDTADAAQSDQILAACMVGKGYSPAS